MNNITQQEVRDFVEQNIVEFHRKRIEKLQRIKLDDVLKRKNPYLFKAKNVLTAEQLVRGILDAFLSSQEEGIFGGFLEQLAIFVCSRVYGGRKSSAEGIDLEFQKAGVQYIVTIKSGPNWGNSSQINRMRDNFRKAKRILGTNRSAINVVAVNGCCYGKDNHPDKGEYLKLCGARFWEFISDQPDLYVEIIEPLGHQAKEHNADFDREYAQVINRMTAGFLRDFCDANGAIDWKAIVRFNSAQE